jgi:hypothetical protein
MRASTHIRTQIYAEVPLHMLGIFGHCQQNVQWNSLSPIPEIRTIISCVWVIVGPWLQHLTLPPTMQLQSQLCYCLT